MLSMPSDLTGRRLAAQHALSRILASSSGRESLPRILEVIGGSLEADVAELWVADRDASVLRCEAVWFAPGVDGGEFSKAAKATTFPRGRGLPGRAWVAGVPEWTKDAMADADFRRKLAAHELGLHAAVAFPIQYADETMGVIQTFSRHVLEPNPELLAIFADVGSQVGMFLERARMGDALLQQAREILDLSTPVLRIWKGVLFAPLVGTLDAKRARQLEERVLLAITHTQSPVLLLDVTGIPMIDMFSAQHLIQTVRAVRLLGAKVVVSGLSPQIAMTLTNLGIVLDEVETFGSLADGLARAIALLGYEVTVPAS